jgi:hypothetical protein
LWTDPKTLEQMMKSLSAIALAALACAAMLSACDKGPQPSDRGASQARVDTPAQSATPTTPANIGQPSSQEEKREGANPVQGQVDPKEREQHKDFQQRGDSAGPSGPDTKPRGG